MKAARAVMGGWLVFCSLSSGTALGQEGPAAAMVEQREVDRAVSLERAGRADEAMQVIDGLLAEYPGSLSALVLLARIAEETGDPGRALPAAERAVRQGGPGLPTARQVWIRTLQASGLPDSALAITRRWIARDPTDASAYAALSELRARSGNVEGAIRALQEGRTAIGSDHVFVQELAALQAENGRYADAAAEWREMLAWGDAGVEAVGRWLRDPGLSREGALGALREEFESTDATLTQRNGAVRLALLVGEFEWAREVVESTVTALPEAGGDAVLRDYVGLATDAGDPAGAGWAADMLAARSHSPDEARYWTATAAELSLEAGRREAARQSFAHLLSQADPGSELYGVALRRLHELTVRDDPEGAGELLREHLNLYPDDYRESVEMAVRAAEEWLTRGRLERARGVLASVPPRGPEEAALQAPTLGRIELLAGHPGAARPHLELAGELAAAEPGKRIEALEMLMLVEECDSARIDQLGRGLVKSASTNDDGPLLDAVDGWARERPAGGDLLATFAADALSASGRSDAARRVRLVIVERWPSSPAAPRALLDLARDDREAAPEQAEQWLERLIVGYPESAMAPVARRVLAELQGGVPGA